MSTTSTKVSEAYTKKKTAIKGQFEETGIKRLIRERSQAAIERTSKKTQEGVVKSLADLKVRTTEALDSISSTLSSEIAALKDVQEAIKAEEANLKNVHDISVEADSLQALILAHKDERESFHLEQVNARKTWEEEKKALEISRRRDDEQYRYDTDKRHREEQDKINAQRLEQQKTFEAQLATRAEAVTNREEVMDLQENELKSLREASAKYEETLKKEVERAVAIATNSLKKDLTHDHALKMLESQNQLSLKISEIAQLNARVAELVKQNQQLDVEYKAASTKVQQIAEKAIDGAARQQTVVQVPGSDAGDQRRK